MMPRAVAQVSVRLSEGGAAGVARALSDGLRGRGIRSPFIYGYGSGGRDSPLADAYEGTRVTPLAIAGVNRIAYRTIGKDTSLRSPARWAQMRREFESVDVIHLHVIHTFFASTKSLFDLLVDLQKPVVWTLHDQWAMTGRCAQPAGCELWRTGCTKCPNLAAYPEAWIDKAAPRWVDRRGDIARLQSSLPTAIVACAEWLARAAQDAGLRNVSTVTNSVDKEFWESVGTGLPRPKRSVLFVCRDLRDAKKVDWQVLRAVAAHPGLHLTIVGDDSPAFLEGATYLPSVTSRRELAEIMSSHESMVFTSDVDYYPLTVAEALTAGMTVVAKDSPATREFDSFPGVRVFGTEAELLGLLQEPGSRPSTPLNPERFHPDRMVQDYLDLYGSLL